MSKLLRFTASPARVDLAITWIGRVGMVLCGFATVVFIIAALLAHD